jgi:hypothetical protein
MRKIRMGFFERWLENAAGETERLETGEPASFRFVGIDRKGHVIAASGVRDMICTSP